MGKRNIFLRFLFEERNVLIEAKEDHPAAFYVLSSFMLMGILVRLRYYFSGLSLWNDEAALAINIVNLPYTGFFKAFDNVQTAPIGFCIVEKAAISMLGTSEAAFRLFPLICGIVSLFFVYLFCRQAFGIWVAALCVAQIAVNPESIYYSYTLKPYCTDFAVASVLVFIAYKYFSSNLDRSSCFFLAVAGGISVWFSFPSVLLLFAIGSIMMGSRLFNKDYSAFAKMACMSVFWLGNFLIQYKLLETNANNAAMLLFWEKYFMPLPPFSGEDFNFFFETMLKVFRNPLWTSHPYVSIVLYVLGMTCVWKKSKSICLLIGLPIVLNLVLSALHKYPFGDRLMLYAVMILYIPIAVFLVKMLQTDRKKSAVYIISILLIALNLGEPSVNAVKHFIFPKKQEQVKQAIEYILEKQAAGDRIYVHFFALNTVRYYAQELNISADRINEGRLVYDTAPDIITKELASLKGRVWLLFGHAKQLGGVDYEKLYVDSTLQRGGKELDRYIDTGASAYLFML